MEELIKLREYCVTEKEKAYQKGYHSTLWTLTKPVTIRQRGKVTAFSAVIKQLDLILNNSVVKPSERRSPTDETFDGVSRPNERQNPQEYKILECGCSIKINDSIIDIEVNKDCIYGISKICKR